MSEEQSGRVKDLHQSSLGFRASRQRTELRDRDIGEEIVRAEGSTLIAASFSISAVGEFRVHRETITPED
jgi:hypothetical protein